MIRDGDNLKCLSTYPINLFTFFFDIMVLIIDIVY